MVDPGSSRTVTRPDTFRICAVRCPNPNDLIALKWRQLRNTVQLSKYSEIWTLTAKKKVWMAELEDELMIGLNFIMTGNFVLNARSSL